MDEAEIKKAFDAWRDKYRRTAWVPETQDGPNPDSGSWFGGHPLVTEGKWPVCKECSEPMMLFAQLDLAELPEEADLPTKEGLLQVFYCSSDDGGCETWEPFSGTHELRVVSPGSAPVTPPADVASLPQKSILRWRAVEDLPSSSELEMLGVEVNYDFQNETATVRCEEFGISLDLSGDLDVEEILSNAEAGDKLRGWPFWIQGVEYPSCPTCGEAMELLLQLDSEDNLDYMFGDSGCAHVTQCRRHPDQLALGWACC